MDGHPSLLWAGIVRDGLKKISCDRYLGVIFDLDVALPGLVQGRCTRVVVSDDRLRLRLSPDMGTTALEPPGTKRCFQFQYS